ncbi:hypothetical protein [Abditibacterium utsteinense]|uniref:hypothetical protein n=1 Tax=Abditibacterium utsteinense TaxID=1960156 RepID=UPI0014737F2F|nr:hypothetical protein [Abditibacterium utsteinense]
MKLIKSILFLFGSIITAAIAFPILAYQLEQPHQREIQTKVLNGNFTKVQLQNGKILFVTDHPRLITTAGNQFFDKPVLLSIGSQFKASDPHWGAAYTITRIDLDGVVIHFDASGDVPSAVRRSSGNVKLAWK